MSVLEIMKSQENYIAGHSSMPNEKQIIAKKLCREYNNTMPDEEEKRLEILTSLFGTCNPLTFIEPDFRCDYGYNIHTNGLTVINYNCVMLDTSPIILGKNVLIGPGSCLACVGHAIDPKQRADGVMISRPINLEDDVWIGANCTVCGGVTIGKGSIIGAGSVVKKNIPEGVIAAGNPCKIIRQITEEDKINPEEIR